MTVAAINGLVENDATDAEFKRVNGLGERECISFESTKYPGQFLSYVGSLVRLGRVSVINSLSDLPRRATFCPTESGLEALHDPGSYMYVDGNSLKVDKLGSIPDLAGLAIEQRLGRAWLGLVDGSRPFIFATAGAVSFMYEQIEGDYQIFYDFGECSPEITFNDLINYWVFGTPLPVSTAVRILSYPAGYNPSDPRSGYRIVTHSATTVPSSITGYQQRFSPFIKIYIPYDGKYTYNKAPVAKIETGQAPCRGDRVDLSPT